tara:strand:+ start:946 stop:1266 length:321 start_codon:yes stop_codon:yes gene_type:complete
MPISYPYTFADWYGYDKDFVAVTPFNSGSGQPDAMFICSQSTGNTYYHDGSGTWPVASDKVYTNSAGTTPAGSGYYTRSNAGVNPPNGFYRITGILGVVQSTSTCP